MHTTLYADSEKTVALGINDRRSMPLQSTHWLKLLTGSLAGRTQMSRQYDIDAVRGMAIILVVIGHVVARDMPLGNAWYETLKTLIYRFHMPLFMTLTGISFALSLPKFPDWPSLVRFSKEKMLRLAVPYLFFGLLILVGKMAASYVIHVDNPPQGILHDVLALVVRPNTSVASFLWFIYVLGLYCLVLPAFLQLIQRRVILLFVGALVCLTVTWPQEILLSQAFFFLPYFTGGMLLWMLREKWSAIHGLTAVMWIVIFAGAMAFAIPMNLPKWLLGALSVPAFLGLAQHLPAGTQRMLAKIGQLSLSIYLMNTIFIGLIKGLLLKLVPWDGYYFLFYFPVLAIGGLALPVVVKRLTHRHLLAVDRYI
jgi:fucose 4-O-acetylase-like acetyltransferase